MHSLVRLNILLDGMVDRFSIQSLDVYLIGRLIDIFNFIRLDLTFDECFAVKWYAEIILKETI